MEQSQLRKPNFLIVVGLKPSPGMKRNWNPALDLFLIQVTRPPRTCWVAVLFQYPDTPGLLGHELRKTLRRLPEALEEGSLSPTQNSPGNLSALGLQIWVPLETSELPQDTWLSQHPKGTQLLFGGGGLGDTCWPEVTSPKWLL